MSSAKSTIFAVLPRSARSSRRDDSLHQDLVSHFLGVMLWLHTYLHVGQEPPSVIRDLHSIYSNLEYRHHKYTQDVVYDTPDITPSLTTKKNSNSSLGGEPIDRSNPPLHFLNPPDYGSSTESDSDAYAYSETRPFSHVGYHSDGDRVPLQRQRFRQQQLPHSDSIDSALNRMSHHNTHRVPRVGPIMPPGHFTPPLTQSPLLLHTTTNSSAADAGSPSHDIRGTPMPLPRTATLPQGQPCHTAGRANASPAGQQFQH
jgi:hypothetical protein